MKNEGEKNLLKLAHRFKAFFDSAERSLWSAGVEASKAKTIFEGTPRVGRWSWTQYCQDALGRDVDTVSAYVRAVRYCVALGIKIDKSLPVIALVGELAGAPKAAQPELHKKLFDDRLSASEFRDALREAKKGLNEDVLDSEKPSAPLLSSQYIAKIKASETVVEDRGAPSLVRIFSALQPEREAFDEAVKALKPGQEYLIKVRRAS